MVDGRQPTAAGLAILKTSMNEPSFRIIGAFCVGIALVGVAFYAVRYDPEPGAGRGVASKLIVDDTIAKQPREFIPVSDTDGDNIPDWQNQFDIPTVTLDGKPDTDRVDTLTSQTALNLAESLFSETNSTNTLTPTQRAATLAEAIAAELATSTYTAADMRTTGDTRTDWRRYGNQVAAITFEHQVEGEVAYELVLLDRVLAFRNQRALDDLTRLAKSYEVMATAMLETPAPPSAMEAHVSLTNAYTMLAADLHAFASALDDPVRATVHFGRYPESVDRLYTTIIALYTALHEAGITWEPGDPAYELIAVEE